MKSKVYADVEQIEEELLMLTCLVYSSFHSMIPFPVRFHLVLKHFHSFLIYLSSLLTLMNKCWVLIDITQTKKYLLYQTY